MGFHVSLGGCKSWGVLLFCHEKEDSKTTVVDWVLGLWSWGLGWVLWGGRWPVSGSLNSLGFPFCSSHRHGKSPFVDQTSAP